MQTSYFAIASNLPNAISIAAKSPDFYNGREYLPLAPTWQIFSEYQKSHDIHVYTERYFEEILLPLNPQEVLDDLGRYSVLLCWESPDKFCHRRIVAKWLEDSLNIKVPEL
jgi:hypothetical protein